MALDMTHPSAVVRPWDAGTSGDPSSMLSPRLVITVSLLLFAGQACAQTSPTQVVDPADVAQTYLARMMIDVSKPEIAADGMSAEVRAFVAGQRCTLRLQRTKDAATPWLVSSLHC